MRSIIVFALLIVLAGCEATAVKDSASIQTQKQLSANISKPVQLSIAYYVDKSKPERGVNFFGKLEEATQLVSEDMFTSSEKLSSESDVQYFFKLSTNSRWDRAWGNWDSEISLVVLDRSGKEIHRGNIKNTSRGGGVYDFDAVYNAFAAGVKEMLIEFVNNRGGDAIKQDVESFSSKQVAMVPIKKLLEGNKPSSSGTGFFINDRGVALTAAHVIDSCIYLDLRHKGQTYSAKVAHSSNLLDLAVLTTDYSGSTYVSISPKSKPTLGKQVFVTGFPLANLLAEYPSLTVGNISSLGGLKGAKGHFQFSAPIQPGNSGGAIVDYKGNLQGLVSSTLNQKMMLSETGTTSQNVNFGIELDLIQKFLKVNNVAYKQSTSSNTFDKSSAMAVEYSNQILCYQ